MGRDYYRVPKDSPVLGPPVESTLMVRGVCVHLKDSTDTEVGVCRDGSLGPETHPGLQDPPEEWVKFASKGEYEAYWAAP